MARTISIGGQDFTKLIENQYAGRIDLLPLRKERKMYLDCFKIPIDKEEAMLKKRMIQNGGPKHGYIDNSYPCGLFFYKQFHEVNFDRITIFYGGNGSGKSTLLNLIAQKLKLNWVAPYNSGEMFDLYVEECTYETGEDDEGFPYTIPAGSRIITSDDIFDYMLSVRENNEVLEESKEDLKEDWRELRYGETIQLKGLEDYETLRKQVLARSRSVSRRQYIRRLAGGEVKLNSNGETALEYFHTKLKNDKLYLLDEPENSMSPQMQLKLVEMLKTLSRYCGCQFVIATHSPLLLAIEGARIYDLDACPVTISNWWELENTRILFDFFDKHRDLFR